MGTDLAIRPATVEDEDAVWAMLEPVFRAGDTYAVDPDISRADALDYWFRRTPHVYIAEDEAPRGTFYIRKNYPGGGAHVCNCGYVTGRGSEGRGVARAMLAFSMEEAKRLGFEAMQFNFVLADNTRAVETWKRAGFVEVGRQPRAFRKREAYVDALILHRFL